MSANHATPKSKRDNERRTMKTLRHTRCTVTDYAAMKQYLNKHSYKYEVIFDTTTDEFEFTYYVEEDYYLAVMNDLNDMRNSHEYDDYFDSINTAINAIATLQDMGVIK